ncbi:MAG: TetR/AcrR family transcriptional regulator, partial [Bacteroidota bacterium]
AERAEFGKGTIYNYFPGGKDELYFALFEEVVGSLHGIIEREAPGPEAVQTRDDVRDGFRRLMAGLIEHFQANRGVLLLFMKDGHRMMLQPEKMAHFAGRFAEIIDAMAHPVEAAVEAGALRPLPPRAVAHMIMGNVRGYLMAEIDADCDPTGSTERPDFGTPEQAADFITTILFDGLLAPGDASP